MPLHNKTREITAIYPYCGVQCGIIMAVQEGEVIGVEGDPDSRVNQASLCPEVPQYMSVPTAHLV